MLDLITDWLTPERYAWACAVVIRICDWLDE